MQTGNLIADRYQLTKPVRTAWLARDLISGRSCVLKPREGFVDNRVAEWLGQVWHPGLPRLLDKVGISIKSSPEAAACASIDQEMEPAEAALSSDFFVFEYRAGQSLRSLADERGGRLPAAEILPLLSQAASIVAYLHEQGERPVLHLDIKPEHILLEPDGRISLIDFSAARIGDKSGEADATSVPCMVAATPLFASPEHLAGHPCRGSDIYALALVAVHLLSGKSPDNCRTQDIADLIPEASPSLQSLLARCLQPSPARRLDHAGDLQNGLAAAVELPSAKPGACPIQANLPEPGQEKVKDRTVCSPLQEKLVCIWDCAEFACELAAVLAEKQDVLVIDANQLDPRADLLLACHQSGGKGASPFMPDGLDLALLEEQRGRLDTTMLGHLAQPTGLPRVRLLATRVGMEHYDHFSVDSLEQVFRQARLVCDMTLVLCSRFIFDAFTCLTLLMSDLILVPRPGESGSFRECSRSLDLLASRYPLDLKKILYVAFPYRSGIDLSKGTLDALCHGRLLGCISEQQKRHSMKSGAVPYAAALEKISRHEYQKLIRRMQSQTGRQPCSRKQPLQEVKSCLW